MTGRAFFPAILAVAGALHFAACSARVDPASRAERYELTGRVVAIDEASGRVTVAHKAVPGYMDAMTMEFAVEPRSDVSTLAMGDRLRATLVVAGDRSWIENLERLDGEAAGFEVEGGREPEIGAVLPAFELVDSNGHSFGPQRFAGRPTLLTFIYTRCPLPDYCERMTSNFEAVALELKAAGDNAPALLVISIDPDYDSPEVLREYARKRVSQQSPVDRWTFATGSTESIRDIASFCGLSYETRSGQIVHSLRTIVISPDGRVAAILRGNSWTAEEAVAELRKARGRP